MRPFQPPSRGRAPAGGTAAFRTLTPPGGTAHVSGARSLQPVECGVEVSGGRGSPKPHTHQLRKASRLYSPYASYVVFVFPPPPSRQMYCLRKMQEKQGCSFLLRMKLKLFLWRRSPQRSAAAQHARSGDFQLGADPASPALLSPRRSFDGCTRRSYTKQFSRAHYWTKLRFELTFSGHDDCFEAGR